MPKGPAEKARLGSKPRPGGILSGMDALRLFHRPALQEPLLVLAFLGWNDAAESASGAIRYLRRPAPANPFAEIDPEEFFIFTEQRPQIRLTAGQQRELRWPTTDFTVARLPGTDRDLILGLGAEPHLKWRSFAAVVLQLCNDLDVREVVTLGALLSDTPHTRPVPLTGITSDPERATALGFAPTRYEGPTGIVGVINDTLRRAGRPYLSLWANVPHYVAGGHNPRATQTLLQRFAEIFAIPIDLRDLDLRARRFEADVTNALKDNPDVQEYVRRLESAAAAEPTDPPGPAPELRSADVLDEVDRLLRKIGDDEPPTGTPPVEGG